MIDTSKKKTDKHVLLSVGDGPEGIEIFTSEDMAVIDWAHDGEGIIWQ